VGSGGEYVAYGALVLGMALTLHSSLTRWPALVGTIVLIILFVPIRRYKLGANLPFDLEPYRIAVALIVAPWLGTVLVDGRVSLRKTFVDPPLLLFLVAVVGSIV